MDSFRLLDRRSGYIAAAIMLALTLVVSALASAAQVTERSIALSSSSAGADNVTYQVKFKAVGAAGAFVVDFCNDSPIIGQTCTPPPGFSASSAASTTSGFTDVDGGTNKVVVTGAISAGQNVTVDLTGINNPDDDGPLYARILTFTNATPGADEYTSTAPGTGAAPVDEGGVAISITPTIGVSGAVLESMTFCIAGGTIAAGCDLDGNTPPVLALGETVGSTKALDSGFVSTGSIFSQLSTNAVGGAIVNLKSGAECGGLKRFGVSTCDIEPAQATNVVAGQAKFGVRLGTAQGVGTLANGTLVPVEDSGFNTTDYLMPWVIGNTTGVSSVYGAPIFETDGAPANNQNMEMTFGASISNSTPAGNYSADLSMIATGKF